MGGRVSAIDRVSTRRRLASAVVVGAAALALAALGDDYLAHGFLGTYRASHDGRVETLSTRFEHRTAFPNLTRPLARYVQAWPFDRWGVPSRLPPLDVELAAILTVPPGPPLLVRAESPNTVSLSIDGRTLANARVESGSHRVRLRWTGAVETENARSWEQTLPASLKLEWGADASRLREVPRTALHPPRTDPLRIALWVVVPALSLFAALFLVIGASTVARQRRRLAILAAAAVLALGLGFRLYDYDAAPDFRVNGDELFATWNGYQLLTNGSTLGWSLWARRYDSRFHRSQIQYFRQESTWLVSPYFEHPPLAHLLVGAAAYVAGATNFAHARLEDTRLVPIALSMLVLVLVMLIARKVSKSPRAWLFAGLVYASVPTIVLQGRVIKEEMLVAPLSLLAVLAWLHYRTSRRRRALVLGAMCAAACGLAKIPGFAFLVGYLMLVASTGSRRDTFIATIAASAVSSLLLLYAARFGWGEFWYTTQLQATIRRVDWDFLVRFFSDSAINSNRLGRGWILFLWIATFAAFLADTRRWRELSLMPLLWLVAIALGSGSWYYGWYLLPLYPFLAIGAGEFLSSLWESPDLLRGLLFSVLLVSYGLIFTVEKAWVLDVSHWPLLRTWATTFCGAVLLAYLPAHLLRTRWAYAFARFSTAVGLVAFLLLAGFFVVEYDAIARSHDGFDLIGGFGP